MLATNKDILEFYFDGRKRGVKRLQKGKPEYREHVSRFSKKRMYSFPSQNERGWLYGYFSAGDLQAFMAIAHDRRQQRFFHEVRIGKRKFLFGEGQCQIKFSKDRVHFSDKKRSLKWFHKDVNYSIEFSLKRGKGELIFKYTFKEISPEIGNYRCVFRALGRVLAGWVLNPAKADVEIIAKNLDVSSLPEELRKYVGLKIETDFAYTENVRIYMPLVSSGWGWNVFMCKNETESRFVGLMEFFVDMQKRKVPINFQFYYLDPKTGRFCIYGDAKSRLSFERGLPVISAESLNHKMRLNIRALSMPKKRMIRGVSLLNMLNIPSANIDYSAFPSSAEATIDGKKYSGTGTSELTGTKKLGYWM